LSSLPLPLRMISQTLPATHFVAISRGIIIRGANLHDLLHEVTALVVISAVLLTASITIFRRRRL
jgi:ABC-2 type transport system permease protein